MFLLDVFDGDEELGTAVDHLLVVGFYLVNLGCVSIALETTDAVVDAVSAVEALSVEVGTVVLVLGVLHLANLYVLNKLRRRAQLQRGPGRPPAPAARRSRRTRSGNGGRALRDGGAALAGTYVLVDRTVPIVARLVGPARYRLLRGLVTDLLDLVRDLRALSTPQAS